MQDSRGHMEAVVSSPVITSGTGRFKAICYQCHYEGFEPHVNTCGRCGFPMILEPYERSAKVPRPTLARAHVELNVPLPGVDDETQILRRRSQRFAAVTASQPVPLAGKEPSQPAPLARKEPALAATQPPEPASALPALQPASEAPRRQVSRLGSIAMNPELESAIASLRAGKWAPIKVVFAFACGLLVGLMAMM